MARLRPFFEEYASALSESNIESIARAYAEQFMATGPGYHMSLSNDEQFRAELAQTAQFYQQIGVDVVEIKNYLEAALDSGFWLVKIEWELLDKDLNTLVTFDTTYVIDAGRNVPKILLYIAHNEQERMQDAGLIPGSNGG
jgi:hypothetical protein